MRISKMKLFNLFKKQQSEEIKNIKSSENSNYKLYIDDEYNLDSIYLNNIALLDDNEVSIVNSKYGIEWSTSTEIDTTSPYKSSLRDENLINQIKNLIEASEFEYGNDSILDSFLGKQLRVNNLRTKENVNNLFLDNMNNPKILTGILRTISHFDESLINPNGMTMAVAALSHQNLEVKECAVRAFENWGGEASLRLLENLEVEVKWLQDYIDNVIIDIKEELCLS